MLHKFYQGLDSLYLQTPNTKKLELFALGAATVGTILNCSSSPTSMAGVAAWNLSTKLLMRSLSNNYFAHSKYEHIMVKVCDVPVNVAATTFLSSGISPYLTSFELGTKFAQAIAYGVFGQIIKDFSSSLVDNLTPKCDLPEKDKGKSIPAGNHTLDCFKYFLVQLVKFTFSPLKYVSLHNVGEQSLAGFLRNLTNEFLSGKNPFQKDGDINPILMGCITHPIYMVTPPLLFSSYTFFPKCVFSITVDSLERAAFHYFEDKPFTRFFAENTDKTKEKAR